MEKLIDQFEFDWSEKSSDSTSLPELSEERATVLFILDTLNKYIIETTHHPVRKSREILDQFARDILRFENQELHRVLFRFRQFFGSFRMDEYTFVQKTFDDFRAIIWDFVDQLAEDVHAEENEDQELLVNLESLKEAVEANSITELKDSSRQFIDFYMEHHHRRETRRDHRMNHIKKNLDSVRKKLVEANQNMMVDHLTKAFNRRSFDDQAHQYWRLFRASKKAITVMTLDIDHFKKINDNYGHPIGDFVLVELVKMLKDLFVREADFVARVGGEEFAILLPDYNLEHAVQKAEGVLNRVRAETFVKEDMRLQFTVSIGLAQLEDHEPLENWLKRADDALYESKKTGRNRFTVAKPSKLRVA